jgi:hypothetical protein
MGSSLAFSGFSSNRNDRTISAETAKSNCRFLHFAALWSKKDRTDWSSRFDFRGAGFYKCGCHRNSFHDSLDRSISGGKVTTTIVRMLGKAVKIRHCPATVSAKEKPARAMLRCCAK